MESIDYFQVDCINNFIDDDHILADVDWFVRPGDEHSVPGDSLFPFETQDTFLHTDFESFCSVFHSNLHSFDPSPDYPTGQNESTCYSPRSFGSTDENFNKKIKLDPQSDLEELVHDNDPHANVNQPALVNSALWQGNVPNVNEYPNGSIQNSVQFYGTNGDSYWVENNANTQKNNLPGGGEYVESQTALLSDSSASGHNVQNGTRFPSQFTASNLVRMSDGHLVQQQVYSRPFQHNQFSQMNPRFVSPNLYDNRAFFINNGSLISCDPTMFMNSDARECVNCGKCTRVFKHCSICQVESGLLQVPCPLRCGVVMALVITCATLVVCTTNQTMGTIDQRRGIAKHRFVSFP